MKIDDAKPFRCGSGHALGLAVKDGNGAVVLLLYRQALTLPSKYDGTTPSPSPKDGGGEQDMEVDVVAIVEGYAAEVRCSICGRVRSWVPGEVAMRHLLERMRAVNNG